jgi:23S rRNA pseudouridine2604 synthase
LNRQIRRMCKHFGYAVNRLQRARIMHIELGKLPVGQWRDLTANEIAKLTLK